MLWFKRNREDYVRGLLVHNNIKTIFDRYRLYRTINKPQDEVETFEYSRWKDKPTPNLRGLKLEEHQDEFMKM